MIKCNGWPISICTWSLNNDFNQIAAIREQTQLSHINLALSPVLDGDKNYLSAIKKQGWVISATMVQFPQEDYTSIESIKATGGIVPEKYWEYNRKRVLDSIDMTALLGVKYLLFHFGFLDQTDKNAGTFYDKVKLLADYAAKKQVMLLMETGQESAIELRQFLEELNHPAVGVNFDPANMILYDKGEPVQAVHILAKWIKHIHIKDALRTKTLGTWGKEVPWGTGQVGSTEFLKNLKQIKFSGALAIEREAVNDHFNDIKNAINALKNFTV